LKATFLQALVNQADTLAQQLNLQVDVGLALSIRIFAGAK
jgi:hypothetical protein